MNNTAISTFIEINLSHFTHPIHFRYIYIWVFKTNKRQRILATCLNTVLFSIKQSFNRQISCWSISKVNRRWAAGIIALKQNKEMKYIGLDCSTHKTTHFASFWASLSFLLHCFPLHATSQTFLISAVLTSVSLFLIDDTISMFPTCIRELLSHSSLKESFAAFATERKRKSKKPSLNEQEKQV